MKTMFDGRCTASANQSVADVSCVSKRRQERRIKRDDNPSRRGHVGDMPQWSAAVHQTILTKFCETSLANLPKSTINLFSLLRCGYSCFSIAIVLLMFVQRLAIAQRIDTQPQTFHVRVGESVQLPCNFAEPNSEETVVMWKRGEDLLALDEELTGSDNRVQLKKEGLNYVLEISPIESYDSATYTCSVSSNPPVEITHRLQVDVSPSAKLVPSNSPLLTRAGKEVIVKCAGTGNPPPSFVWTKRSSARPLSTSDGRLYIAKATPSDSGIYECRAKNGVGDDAIVTVEIRVENIGETSTESSADKVQDKTESAPWVETDRTYVPAKLGSAANLSCRYDGEPEPNADWLFAGFKINNFDSKFKSSAKFGTFVKNHSMTTFAINEVREDHFGDYTCKISNRLGTVERTIHFSGRPGPPLISVLNDNSLSWTVQSAQPIFEYKIHYRLANEDMWTHNKIVSSSKNDQQGEYWTHKILLSFLNANTNYEIQVNARNDLGWGSLARDFVKYRTSSDSEKISSNVLDKNVNAANARFNSLLLCTTMLGTAIVVLRAVLIL